MREGNEVFMEINTKELRGGVGSSPSIIKNPLIEFQRFFWIFLTEISTNLESSSVSDSSELSPFAVVNFQLTTPYFYLTEMQKKNFRDFWKISSHLFKFYFSNF
jgi:hypothetical protein